MSLVGGRKRPLVIRSMTISGNFVAPSIRTKSFSYRRNSIGLGIRKT